MATRTSTFGDDAWRTHATALRRLALGLVRDGNDADELVQEVWLRARGDASRSRGWFTVTLRNLVADRARSRARRTAHEHAVARAEPVPSAEEVLERLEIAEELARELARLAEPYRLVLHLRYFEDLAPDEVAARLGQPRETVRTRLRRALAELRARMDRVHGGERRAWALAVVPLAREGAGTAAGAPLALAASIGGIAMATKVVASAAVLAAAVLVTWWARAEHRLPAEAPTLAVQPPELAVPAAPGATAEPARREALATQDVQDAPRVAAPALTAPDTREVEVRIVVVDEQGAEHGSESGTLVVGLIENEGEGDVVELPFERGELALDVPAGRKLVFGRLIARGREAALTERVAVEPGDEPLVVRGTWLPRGTLRVIDAETQQDLTAVEVRHADGWRANPSWIHPGDHPSLKVAVTDGVSPVALPERLWLTPYWVHAPGHAWTRVDFDHVTGGTRTVELSRERGTVELTCAGTPPPETHARLYGPGSTAQSVLELPIYAAAVSVRLATPGPTRIEDLAPGRYLALLETGEYEERVHLGPAVELELVAGGTARVALPLEPDALAEPMTHLVGTLRVPVELLGGRRQMRLERLDGGQADRILWLGDMDESEDDETLLLWDAGEVRTGTYLANLPLQFRILFQADVAGGESHVALEMPPVGTVAVEVVDASGAPLAPKRLTWSVGPLAGVSHTTRSGMERAADGTWRFLAPQGRIDVSASQPGYMDADETLELAGPEARVRLELRRAMGVRVLLRDGDAAVQPDFSWFSDVRLRAADGTPVLDHLSIAGEIASRSVREPGTYTISFPPLEGFRPIPERTLDIGLDEVVDVIVPLERD